MRHVFWVSNFCLVLCPSFFTLELNLPVRHEKTNTLWSTSWLPGTGYRSTACNPVLVESQVHPHSGSSITLPYVLSDAGKGSRTCFPPKTSTSPSPETLHPNSTRSVKLLAGLHGLTKRTSGQRGCLHSVTQPVSNGEEH